MSKNIKQKEPEKFLDIMKLYRSKDPRIHWWKRHGKNNKTAKKFF